MSEHVLVLSTVGSAADGERIARALVERRLAACVNLLPGVLSVYRWQGEVRQEQEWLLLVKTREQALPSLRAALVSLHPYELPELVALPISAGHEPYLRWIDDSLER